MKVEQLKNSRKETATRRRTKVYTGKRAERFFKWPSSVILTYHCVLRW